jgi:hypothetical protein
VLVLLSAANVVAVFFVGPGEQWHATAHAILAVGFGLWAQRRVRREEASSPAEALDQGSTDEIAALRDDVADVRRELSEVQERLDFTERRLTQAREVERPGRQER